MIFYTLCLVLVSTIFLNAATTRDAEPSKYLIVPVDANSTVNFNESSKSEDGTSVIIYALDHNGIFHCNTPHQDEKPSTVLYTVTENGILAKENGPYAIQYRKTTSGDLIPTENNTCFYSSEIPSFYIQGPEEMLIPVKLFYKHEHVYYVHNKRLLLHTNSNSTKIINTHPKSLKLGPNYLPANLRVVPDESCNGDINLFLLQSNGIFVRNPPDPYLPKGMKLTYVLHGDGSLVPSSQSGLRLSYETEDHGDLKPCRSNSHTLTTFHETTKSFMLCEGGVLAPVTEVSGTNKNIDYFHNGRPILKSKQYPKTYSNTSVLLLGSKKKSEPTTDIMMDEGGPKFVCHKKRLTKRSSEMHVQGVLDNQGQPPKSLTKRSSDMTSDQNVFNNQKPPPKSKQCQYVFDPYGNRIPIKPYVYEDSSVALYKLTCKGYIERLGEFKEPEYDFGVQFQLLDNLLMVPRTQYKQNSFTLKYSLKENGTLVPSRVQLNSYKKAPGCFMYYVLSINKDLIPVRLVVEKNRQVEVYYQDCLIHTVTNSSLLDLDIFSTLHEPLFAYVNMKIVVSYADSKVSTGSTWVNPKQNFDENSSKSLYLLGPNEEKIKIAPKLSENGVTTVFVMDSNGILHKSPKDENKNLAIVSYELLHKCVLIKSNNPDNFLYLVDKKGDMLPYCFPQTKLRAKTGTTIKYVSCENDILVPIVCEISKGYVEYLFQEVSLFRRRTYTLEQVMELTKEALWKPNDSGPKAPDLHKDNKGNVPFYAYAKGFFKRFPPKYVDRQVLHSIGTFKISKEGVLVNCQDPNPEDDVIKITLDNDGNMSIVNGTLNLTSKYYCVSETGDLIPVDVAEEKNQTKIYWKKKVLHTQPKKHSDTTSTTGIPTPSGQDPFGIFEQTVPSKNVSSREGPVYMSIPIMDKPKTEKTEEDKCQHLRSLIQQVFEDDPDIKNMNLVVAEALMEECCKLAKKCAQSDIGNRTLT